MSYSGRQHIQSSYLFGDDDNDDDDNDDNDDGDG